MKNYTKTNIGNEGRTELHNALGLTGAEVSVNSLPAGAGVPFVHSHRNNEEIYGVVSGRGKALIDGEEVTIAVGDWLKVAPKAKRQFSAADDEGITFVCIQVKENVIIGKLVPAGTGMKCEEINPAEYEETEDNGLTDESDSVYENFAASTAAAE